MRAGARWAEIREVQNRCSCRRRSVLGFGESHHQKPSLGRTCGANGTRRIRLHAFIVGRICTRLVHSLARPPRRDRRLACRGRYLRRRGCKHILPLGTYPVIDGGFIGTLANFSAPAYPQTQLPNVEFGFEQSRFCISGFATRSAEIESGGLDEWLATEPSL